MGEGKVRVLLVEDDIAIADMFSLLPRLAGHEVIPATDGLAAVSLALDGRPELVLLDVNLPKRDGLTALRLMREKGFEGTVWMLSNYSERAMAARAFAHGATRWMVKSSTRPKEVADLIDAFGARTDPVAGSDDPRNCPSAPILVADDDAAYLAANDAAARLLEVDNELSLIGRHIWDFTPGVELRSAMQLWQQFRRRGKDAGDFVLATRSGRSVPVRYEAFANVYAGLHVSVLSPAGQAVA